MVNEPATKSSRDLSENRRFGMNHLEVPIYADIDENVGVSKKKKNSPKNIE